MCIYHTSISTIRAMKCVLALLACAAVALAQGPNIGNTKQCVVAVCSHTHLHASCRLLSSPTPHSPRYTAEAVMILPYSGTSEPIRVYYDGVNNKSRTGG